MNNVIAIGKSSNITSYPAHTHGVWEVVLYCKGTGTAWSGDREISFEAGTFIVNPPGIPHREFAPDGYVNIAMLVNECPFPPEAAVVVKDPEHAPMNTLMELINREYHLKRDRWQTTCDELFGTLMHYIRGEMNRETDDPVVEKIKNMLVDNIHNPQFTVKHALTDIPLSRFHAMTLFRKKTGRSPMQYLIDLRMRLAVQLLRTTTLSVQEISSQTGFEDPYYFSRLFAKKNGSSPAIYRKKIATKR
ncbi:MAG: AraC family transcriptional regulator [Spirochaetes bacterium]|nr:AraC family transcriptional regulator [Spirochaetota bacterium]